MQEVNVKMYSFGELSEDAKRKVRNILRNSVYEVETSATWDDAEGSFKKFCYYFDVECRNYDIDTFGYSFGNINVIGYWGDNSEIAELNGKHLRRWVNHIVENFIIKPKTYYSRNYYASNKKRCSRIQKEFTGYELTGMCYDYDILEPVMKYYRGDTNVGDNYTYKDLMEECLDSFFSAVQKDFEYYYSDEGVDEYIQANYGEDFLKSGKLAIIA